MRPRIVTGAAAVIALAVVACGPVRTAVTPPETSATRAAAVVEPPPSPAAADTADPAAGDGAAASASPTQPGPAPAAVPVPDDPSIVTYRPLPADAVTSVTAFGADGSDDVDDTAAFRAAMAATEGPIYLPVGTYVISEQLAGRRADGSWRGGLWLVGEDRDRSVIRLADGAAGFGDPAAPRAVIATGSYHFAENYGGDIGEGNEAYGNRIENLTVDTGPAAGAVGIDYLGNNSGSIRHVQVTGSGTTGIALTRRYPGPALLADVTVTGFDIGIDVAHSEYGLTLDTIRLSGQRIAGIRNDGNVLSIADLRSTNTVPALRNGGGSGFVTVVDAVLDGGAAGSSALENGRAGAPAAGLVARDVTSTGYSSAVADAGTPVPGARVGVWSSSRTGAADDASITPQRVPDGHEPDLSRWVNVTAFGADGSDWNDDGPAIQAALDSGATTVYLTPGRYFVSAPLRVPAGVEMIHGFGSTLAPTFGAFADPAAPAPLLVMAANSTTPLVVTQLSVGKLHQASPVSGLICFEQDSARTVVLRATACEGREAAASYRGGQGAGRLFIEDSILSGIEIGAGQEVWARQLDLEGDRTHVTNRGGQLWLLGIKTEGSGTVVDTSAGGRTELVGGLLYPVSQVPADTPAFVTTAGATAVLSYVTSSWSPGTDYTSQVLGAQGQASLTADQLPGRTAAGHTVVRHATGP